MAKFYSTLAGALRNNGLSSMGAEQIANKRPLTSDKDREALAGLLSRVLGVGNDSLVPKGVPGHLRNQWKRAQP